MNLVQKFESYMQDFEQTWHDGDWTRVRRHLTDDFVHERDVRPLSWFCDEGADAALRRWRQEIECFDKQFDGRIFVPKARPRGDGSRVYLDWVCLFMLDGVPALIDEGTEVADFREGRMARLRGEYHPDAIDRMQRWTRQYGDRLPQVGDYFRTERGAGRRAGPDSALV